ARRAADGVGYEPSTPVCQAVVDDSDVEAVSIAVPNALHRDVALAAAAAGKHFWIEKPAGRLPEETAEIAAAVESAQGRSLVGFNYRHAPPGHTQTRPRRV